MRSKTRIFIKCLATSYDNGALQQEFEKFGAVKDGPTTEQRCAELRLMHPVVMPSAALL